ncbi:hypothetical protein ACFL2V_08480 [Pseudomonadota bacterium]
MVVSSRLHSLFLVGVVLAFFAITSQVAIAEDMAPPKDSSSMLPMDDERLKALISRVGSDIQGRPGFWQFMLEKREVMVISDQKADRMRILVPVVSTDKLSAAEMRRLLQANFDSALDARYAIAKGALWSAFIHPLSSLDDKAFLGALGQVINLAATYGDSYTSGALTFNGGDTRAIERRKLIDKLIKKGLAI